MLRNICGYLDKCMEMTCGNIVPVVSPVWDNTSGYLTFFVLLHVYMFVSYMLQIISTLESDFTSASMLHI